MADNPLRHKPMPMTSIKNGDLFEVLPDVAGLTVQIVNVYFVGLPDSDDWVLVDTGMPDAMEQIVEAAMHRFGKDVPPKAILLTHGHFDHVGSAVELAEHWGVPIYAHPQEMPYLTGEERYPDPDPGVEGGLIAKLSGYFPNTPVNLRPFIHLLPEDGRVPGLPGWRWVATPGHTPGHVSFFRNEDRAMIVGDAFVTVRQDKLYQVLTQHKEISGPPRYFTPDWDEARESVKRLSALKPSVAMTGHGRPMSGDELVTGLETLALNFDKLALPSHGKYIDDSQ
ncbi:glyoxylase-like metal-dependent hydrolase (beta-lactamase superfamily II) [Modicisalibacter xianhensis]|uniref:Glyoxylase-like metal-dependent hydrolase (Beta-lactamase superfamily II) n=1 Tax=Modicisalibacter xianhensis TaxID=442341 RepID=A0A4R8FT22_9GAMM|nr:MBL fold metallo-hydrolase [Halomonas xianhensis]TDX29809.1 glyoxylase-like metal-dependent hydrolase (beta-lactamase superfamily II) [Halomonas xianhensis]